MIMKWKGLAPGLLLCVLLIKSLLLSAQVNSPGIRLNQAGFYPAAPKLAILTNAAEVHDFFVLSTNLKDTLYRGVLSGPLQSKNSSTITQTADFSNFKKEGNYVIAIPGAVQSYPFGIKRNIHH